MDSAKDYIACFWKTENSTHEIVCELCPRRCRLKEGQRGFCYVRRNIKGNLVLTAYGRTSGFCIDPIEKKPLNHFYPGTSVLSFGTTGCNLGCQFCQNWRLSRSQDFAQLTETASPESIAQAAKKLGCKSVAFTYNEPVIFAEYAIDVAQSCHANGIKTIAVTAGYLSEIARPKFFSAMDAANVDLKSFTEEFYQKMCFAHLQPVLDTLLFVKRKTNVWLEITTLLIPGLNDSEKEIDEMTLWIAKELGVDVPLHFSAFHPDYRLLGFPPTSVNTLQRARQIAQNNGIAHVYLGNSGDLDGVHTYCSQCHKLLIKREGYALTEYRLKDRNHCDICQTICPGYFDDNPGSWGSRRLPIRLTDR